jgi:hypothetical protein
MSAGQPSLRMEWADAVRMVPADNELGIDAYTVAVAFALDMYMDKNGRCWPSTRLLALRAKVSQNLVTSRIQRLEDAGFLEVTRRLRGVNTYQAVIPPSASRHDADGEGRRASASPDEADEYLPHQSADLPHQSVDLPHGSVHLPHQTSPSASPRAMEPVNPRRGELVNRGALRASPNGSAVGTPPTISPLQKRVDAIQDRFNQIDDETDEAHEGYYADGVDPPDEVFITPRLDARLRAAGYYQRNEINELEPKPSLTADEAREVGRICNTVERWVDADADTTPSWLRTTIRRRDQALAEINAAERQSLDDLVDD